MKYLCLFSIYLKLNYSELFKFGLILFLIGILSYSGFSQTINYSREFNFDPFYLGGDSLINLDPNGEILFKATFEKERITRLLKDIIELSSEERVGWYVAVTIFKDAFMRNPTYKFTLYEPDSDYNDDRNANYPCPETCVPPSVPIFEKMFLHTIRLDANDLITIYNDEDTDLINVHIAFNGDFGTVPTFAIYGLTGEFGNADNLLEPNVDPVYISIPHSSN